MDAKQYIENILFSTVLYLFIQIHDVKLTAPTSVLDHKLPSKFVVYMSIMLDQGYLTRGNSPWGMEGL